jgi:tryptophan synthase beta chain
MTGIEAAGHGIETDKHAASLTGGKPGILHGNKTYLLQDEDGQITEAHSISAGLDYPGLGPEHSWLHESGRVNYVPITDTQALEAFQLCCELEGIIPALESAHALAALPQLTAEMDEDKLLVVNVSGRGDKDIFTVAEALGVEL